MKINSLKKIIKYRLSYSGIKETDFLYNNYFLKNFTKFNENDLNLIKYLLDNYSDREIYSFILEKKIPEKKFKNLFDKIKVTIK